MKRWWLMLAALLVLGFACCEYGGRLLTDRHHVAEYRQRLPSGIPALLSEKLALEGIAEALRTNRYDPAEWLPVPVVLGPDASVLRRGQDPNTALVIMSNHYRGLHFYARVRLAETERMLSVVLSKPK